MLKSLSMIGLLVILAAGILIGGCGQSSSPTPSPSSPPSAPTFGQYAQQGQAVFDRIGASCHGSNGQGARAPALWGSSAHLAKYKTAQGLLDYVSTTMPANAPGSLSHQEYLYVLSYLLVQNNYVSADTTFDESQLINLPLE
jgi:polar amino acid transport system substrate-binding protein